MPRRLVELSEFLPEHPPGRIERLRSVGAPLKIQMAIDQAAFAPAERRKMKVNTCASILPPRSDQRPLISHP